MALIRLRCQIGGSCKFETVPLKYEQAREQVEGHMKYAHPLQPSVTRRPEVMSDCSVEDWDEFLVSWEQYKAEYRLTGPDLKRQLVACCSDEVRRSLSRLTDNQHFTLPEEQLLDHIRQLARHQDPALFVQQFLALTQGEGEDVRHYLTRLRVLAKRSKFSVNCPTCQTQVSYGESLIRSRLIAGLRNDEMKVDILAELDQRLECLSGPSDYAFLLTIRGLVAVWQFPYFTAMDYTLTKESYQQIISDLYTIKLIVLLSVCDMGMFTYST